MSVLARRWGAPPAERPLRIVKRRLVVVDGASRGDAFVVRDGAVIGRSTEADWALEHDRRISGRHLAIELTADGRVAVTDLASRNGTIVDGVRLQPLVATPIVAGTSIAIGCTTIVYEEVTILCGDASTERPLDPH